MEIKTLYFNPYRVCTYVLAFNKECIIVDPGMYSKSEEDRMIKYLNDGSLTPILILITHTHPDHVCGIEVLQQHYTNIPVLGQHFPCSDKKTFPHENDGFIEMSTLPCPIYVIHTPGHKSDSVCYFFPAKNILFTGDTLFNESVGRTDLPEGDFAILNNSLTKLTHKDTYVACKKFLSAPLNFETMEIFPGHGIKTIMQYEIDNNPFMGGH